MIIMGCSGISAVSHISPSLHFLEVIVAFEKCLILVLKEILLFLLLRSSAPYAFLNTVPHLHCLTPRVRGSLYF